MITMRMGMCTWVPFDHVHQSGMKLIFVFATCFLTTCMLCMFIMNVMYGMFYLSI